MFIFDLVVNYVIREIYTSDIELMVRFKQKINKLAEKIRRREDLDNKILEIQN